MVGRRLADPTTIQVGEQTLIVRALASRGMCTFQTEMVVYGAGRIPEIKDVNLCWFSLKCPFGPAARETS
jgi:hypothetical protein